MKRLAALLLLFVVPSCGVVRWAFTAEKPGASSPAQRAVDAIAENGADPGKWIGWLIGGGITAAGGVGYAGGRAHGERRRRQRRTGEERRVAGDI